jgi:hypothetical protein
VALCTQCSHLVLFDPGTSTVVTTATGDPATAPPATSSAPAVDSPPAVRRGTFIAGSGTRLGSGGRTASQTSGGDGSKDGSNKDPLAHLHLTNPREVAQGPRPGRLRLSHR